MPYKWIDFPQPNYASTNADVLLNGKKPAGISMFNGYSFNERCMLSLGIVNDDVQIGDQLTLIWGEPETTGKTSTEPHRQAEIRVRVSPTPYAREARENYADELAHEVGTPRTRLRSSVETIVALGCRP